MIDDRLASFVLSPHTIGTPLCQHWYDPLVPTNFDTWAIDDWPSWSSICQHVDGRQPRGTQPIFRHQHTIFWGELTIIAHVMTIFHMTLTILHAGTMIFDDELTLFDDEWTVFDGDHTLFHGTRPTFTHRWTIIGQRSPGISWHFTIIWWLHPVTGNPRGHSWQYVEPAWYRRDAVVGIHNSDQSRLVV